MSRKIDIKHQGNLIIRILKKFYPPFKCNICGWRGSSFVDFDDGFNHVAKQMCCPNCKSHNRHRVLFAYLQKILPKKEEAAFLHFAPEKSLEKLFISYKNLKYLTADIVDGRATFKEDLTQLSFPSESFDFIMCNHVLEHIQEDDKAMREIFRVLKYGGQAIITVPVDLERDETYDDSSISSPKDRARFYWGFDHLRLYGRDFPKRLAEAGFVVQANYFAVEAGEKKQIDLVG